MIANRSQFVTRRNDFFDLIGSEKLRIEAVPSRYADQRTAGVTRMAGLRSAYSDLCTISALATPTQSDFDRADEICARWGT